MITAVDILDEIEANASALNGEVVHRADLAKRSHKRLHNEEITNACGACKGAK